MNSVPAYKNPAVIANVLGGIVSVLPTLGLLPVPVVGQIGVLVSFGLAIYNAIAHHNSANGLAVVAAAAAAATDKLNAGAGAQQ